ncbi:MFS general substrate transporter [Aspergillus cavernicola]|uniref:MFS general substrate transporter n=1 Tax=Aspergillus cavernicola TaxID=176166 RepID=A0ABR4I6G1_9EURO
MSSSTLSYWQLLFNQGAVTPSVIEYSYPGSGSEEDPYVISWIPDDPRNPLLTPEWAKWAITLLVSFAAMAVALVSSAYTGGLVEIIEFFEISEIVALLGVTLFVIGFAIGPLFWAPLSELYGRRLVYILSMMTLTVFTAGVAGAENTQTLLILRFFAGSLGSAAMAIPGGVIADIFPAVSRGLAGGVYAAAPFLGPTLGPVIGGFIAESGGWRWVEGFLAIFSGVLLLAIVFLLPETYAPLLLKKRAENLRTITGRVYRTPLEVEETGKSASGLKTLSTAFSRPWILLFREPIVFLLSLYMAIIYGILYMLFAAYPIVFQQTRGWSEGTGGLAFLGILIGICLAVLSTFPLYFRYKKKALKALSLGHGRLAPEERLPDSFLGAIALPIGLFWFAWTNSPTIHWLAPIASGIPFGFGMVMVFIPIFNYLIDAYTIFAASVIAANSLLRCLFGAIFPLFTNYMFQDLGIHWASSVPAFLALACTPLPFVFYWYGAWIRGHSRYAAEADAFMERLLGVGAGAGTGTGGVRKRGGEKEEEDEELQALAQ